MRIAILTVWLLLGTSALGQGASEPADFAVLSLIGDQLTIAGPGTHVGRGERRGAGVPVEERTLDGAAAAAVERVIKEVIPGARVTLMVTSAPAIYEAQGKVLALSGETAVLLDALEPLLARIRAGRLVLLTKVRHEPRMRFQDMYFERPGLLEGLGFFVDPAKRIRNRGTGKIAYGYLGVYSYFRISIVDPASRRLLGEEQVIASAALRDPDKEPWDSISAEVKVAAMKRLVELEVAPVMRRLLASTAKER